MCHREAKIRDSLHKSARAGHRVGWGAAQRRMQQFRERKNRKAARSAMRSGSKKIGAALAAPFEGREQRPGSEGGDDARPLANRYALHVPVPELGKIAVCSPVGSEFWPMIGQNQGAMPSSGADPLADCLKFGGGCITDSDLVLIRPVAPAARHRLCSWPGSGSAGVV